MGHFNDLSLSRTAEDERLDRADGLDTSAWQCATCIETRQEERDPLRPTHCRSCPVLQYTVATTNRQHIVTAYNDGRETSRRFYTRDEAGAKASGRRIEQLRAEGYERIDFVPMPRTRP